MKLANLLLTDVTMISFVKDNFEALFIGGVITALLGIGGLCAFIIYAVLTNNRISTLEAENKALKTENVQIKEAQEKTSQKVDEYKQEAEQTMAEANAKRDAIVAEAKAKAEASASSLLDSQAVLQEKLARITLD